MFHSMFGTPVHICSKYAGSPVDESLLEAKGGKHLNRENNFTSENTNILESAGYEEINRRILEGLDEYVGNILGIDTEAHEFYITQSWLNINPKGSSHHKHFHSNALVSGAYYLSAPEGSSITLHSSNTTTITNLSLLRFKIKHMGMHNARSCTLPVQTNNIIYFPSSMEHEVAENVSDTNRVSLSFNVFVKGELGDEKELTKLHLNKWCDCSIDPIGRGFLKC